MLEKKAHSLLQFSSLLACLEFEFSFRGWRFGWLALGSYNLYGQHDACMIHEPVLTDCMVSGQCDSNVISINLHYAMQWKRMDKSAKFQKNLPRKRNSIFMIVPPAL